MERYLEAAEQVVARGLAHGDQNGSRRCVSA